MNYPKCTVMLEIVSEEIPSWVEHWLGKRPLLNTSSAILSWAYKSCLMGDFLSVATQARVRSIEERWRFWVWCPSTVIPVLGKLAERSHEGGVYLPVEFRYTRTRFEELVRIPRCSIGATTGSCPAQGRQHRHPIWNKKVAYRPVYCKRLLYMRYNKVFVSIVSPRKLASWQLGRRAHQTKHRFDISLSIGSSQVAPIKWVKVQDLSDVTHHSLRTESLACVHVVDLANWALIAVLALVCRSPTASAEASPMNTDSKEVTIQRTLNREGILDSFLKT